MTNFETVLEDARGLTPQERLKIAFHLTRAYDGQVVEAIAEAWAEEKLGLEKAKRAEHGIDGKLPNGRWLQVKSKKAGAHGDSTTYITLSPSTLALADDLLIVFVDYETCNVQRTIGPVPISSLTERKGRYYVSDIVKNIAN